MQAQWNPTVAQTPVDYSVTLKSVSVQPMSHAIHSSKTKHSSRRSEAHRDEVSQRIGLAIGVLLVLALVAGLGLVIRGLF
jgi:hypothetical protein